MSSSLLPGAAAAPLPPGPRRRFPGQLMYMLNRDRLTFLRELATYGDVAHVKLGPQQLFLLGHPDLVKEVLVTQNRNFTKGRGLERAKRLLGEGLLTSEGDFHLRQRRLAQPAFHRERVAGYAQVMAAYAHRTQARWQDGATLDAAEEMMGLTLAIAGKTLFDADVEGEAGEIGEALTAALELFSLALFPFAEVMDKLPLPWTRRFNRARARLDATIYRIIASRRASGEDRGDLLSMLLLAQDTEGDGGRMTDEQLRDEVMTILLAGHETTANALAWTWYLLSRHPEAEAALHAEVDAVLLGADGAPRLPTMADLPRLPYARAVFAESLRLYPPAWVVGYRAIGDCEIGGYHVPARSLCVMSQFIIQRDPRWFPDPERFDPGRWTTEHAERPRFAYFPFGGGPRQCIGEQFAWAEGILALATIAREWSLHVAPGHDVTPNPVFTLRPKDGVPVTVHRRHTRALS
ncbi:MAG: cytochrome P450 [Gemmatimonadaceae bacterium]